MEALDALDAAVKGAGHPGERNDLVDNINKVSEDDAALRRPEGRPSNMVTVDNINSITASDDVDTARPAGTSRAYALRRLRSAPRSVSAAPTSTGCWRNA